MSILASYADQVGLTKLEALTHLEAFLEERGLLEEAKRDLDRAGEESAS